MIGGYPGKEEKKQPCRRNSCAESSSEEVERKPRVALGWEGEAEGGLST